MIVIGFTDPYKLVIWTHRNSLPQLEADPDVEGRKVQEIIRDNWRHPMLDSKWPTMKSAIRTARKLVERGDLRLVKVEVESMRQAIMPWAASSDVLCRWVLTTSPQDILYEGPTSLTCAYGHIYVQGGGPVPFAAANHGDTERLHLLLTLRRQEDE